MTVHKLFAAIGKWLGKRQTIIVYGDSFADDSPYQRYLRAKQMLVALSKKDHGPN